MGLTTIDRSQMPPEDSETTFPSITMAGKGDVRENMALGAKSLRRASIPSTYFELPSVHHGELDARADASFDHALEWIDDNARAPR